MTHISAPGVPPRNDRTIMATGSFDGSHLEGSVDLDDPEGINDLPGVPRYIAVLTSQLDELEDQLHGFISKLTPVLTSVPVSDPDGLSDAIAYASPADPLSPLASQLLTLNVRVERIRDRLELALARIEV